MIEKIIINYLLQLIFTVGIIAAFGLAIWFCNRQFYRLIGSRGRAVSIATGFIGTPVHEFGHAAFCLLFGHRITAIKLFQPDSKDGVMGYVNHSYNRKNIYHLIGNFFIGLGPVIFGSLVLLLLMQIFVPGMSGSLFSEMNSFQADGFSFATIGGVFLTAGRVFAAFFSFAAKPAWWLFMIPACSIALHMSLSVPDIKAGQAGFFIIAAALFVADVIIAAAGEAVLTGVTGFFLHAGAFIFNFLAISVILSLLLLLIGFIVKLIRRHI